MSFKSDKLLILKALKEGTYQHEARSNVDVKNLLQMGDVTADEVRKIIERCNGSHHQSSPHHFDKNIAVHVLKRDGWYIKFYCADPDTFFISVHQ